MASRKVPSIEYEFLSTLSLRRATSNGYRSNDSTNFYPRSPCGERRQLQQRTAKHKDFYPRSPCGERLKLCNHALTVALISIHALLAESDKPRYPWTPLSDDISIHALLAESDHVFAGHVQATVQFLSTLSLRRATCPYGRA